MPIRVSDTAGYAYWSTMASALYWAADHGAKVANISYSVQSSSSVQAAAQYMRNKGGVVINSAGNTGALNATVASDALITVSATGSADSITSWSTFGPSVDFSAPGSGIWTTARGGTYSSSSGTSFSSPITAGVVALVMSLNPALTPNEINALLKSTAVDLGTPGYDPYHGNGRINAAAAVAAASGGSTIGNDTTAPLVSITSPGAGSTVSGSVAVNVSATDNVAVTKVELYAQNILVATDTTAPYAFSWSSATVANGSAGLVAKAHDGAGNVAASSPITVSVVNSGPSTVDLIKPVVTLTNPINGTLISGIVSIAMTASDNVGVSSIKIYAGGSLKASATRANNLSYNWDTTTLAPGNYSITAEARDAAGNRTAVIVQVKK
jgi:thermitase